jgi:hypothetical protein
MSFGLYGAERWKMVYNSNPGLFAGPLAYRQWLNSLQEDPSDPEYNALLQREKERFGKWMQVMFPSGVPSDWGPGPTMEQKAAAPKLKDILAKWEQYSSQQKAESEGLDPGRPGATAQSAGGPYQAPGGGVGEPTLSDKQRERVQGEQDKRETQRARYLWSRPTFKGRPIGTDELYTQGGVQDPFLDQFLQDNGIQLSGDSRSKATRSGQYVLMGTEHNDELDADHDVYMFKDDANAASMRVDSNKLAKYQAGLGLTVTGKMDPQLLSLWYQAVEQAQLSAVAGVRMTVEEWFDLLATSAIAKRGGSGGGGGGGGSNLEATDYYRAMMQILGDISGVQG